MLQNSLPNERLALQLWQVMLTVLFQQHDLATFQLEFPVIGQTANLDKQGLWRFDVVGQIQPVAVPDRHHVAGENLGVVVEPLQLRFREVGLDVLGQGRPQMPPDLLQLLQPVVQIGHQAALLAADQLVTVQNQRIEPALARLVIGGPARKKGGRKREIQNPLIT